MFWQNFTRLCESEGKSPNRVAADLGLSNSVATNWKRGAMPRDSVLARIADYFGVSVESLTAEEPPVLLDPDEARLLEDYRGFSYAGRGLVRDFVEKMKEKGIYARGADPFLMGFNEEWAQS